MSKKKEMEAEVKAEEMVNEEAAEQEQKEEKKLLGFIKRPKNVKKGLKIAAGGLLLVATNAGSYALGNHRGYKNGYEAGTEYAENEINYNAYLSAPEENSDAVVEE